MRHSNNLRLERKPETGQRPPLAAIGSDTLQVSSTGKHLNILPKEAHSSDRFSSMLNFISVIPCRKISKNFHNDLRIEETISRKFTYRFGENECKLNYFFRLFFIFFKSFYFESYFVLEFSLLTQFGSVNVFSS